MIPDNLPKGILLLCIESSSSLVKGKRYVLDRYVVGRDRVVVHREGGSRAGGGGGWYLRRFNVLGLPDGRDYQAADDCDLSCEPFTNRRG